MRPWIFGYSISKSSIYFSFSHHASCHVIMMYNARMVFLIIGGLFVPQTAILVGSTHIFPFEHRQNFRTCHCCKKCWLSRERFFYTPFSFFSCSNIGFSKKALWSVIYAKTWQIGADQISWAGHTDHSWQISMIEGVFFWCETCPVALEVLLLHRKSLASHISQNLHACSTGADRCVTGRNKWTSQ